MSDFKDAFEAGQKNSDSAVTEFEINGTPYIARRQDFMVDAVPSLRARPVRVNEHIQVRTVDGLIAYTNRFNSGRCLALADESAARIRVFYDYSMLDLPDWHQHDAILTLQASEEWASWRAANGKLIGQREMAEFLEDRFLDIRKPTSAEILEAMTSMSLPREVTFESAVRLSDGSVSFRYSDQAKPGSMTLPEGLILAVPIYKGGALYEIEAKLRYRMTEGRLTCGFKLMAVERVLALAFADAVGVFAKQFPEVPVVYATW